MTNAAVFKRMVRSDLTLNATGVFIPAGTKVIASQVLQMDP
eukprot:CAMPEP_0116992320 /NCGR_PEP_ID=MMETSP0467-20121206/66724_1 /TAXON_ID=283647 /ORGANISM="Mesodinium pulex, Strain SPMC105" /LENGTH=40 /DNA_ID= /DNA_START= /DNA_END= /DNA_ORIENTATION=